MRPADDNHRLTFISTMAGNLKLLLLLHQLHTNTAVITISLKLDAMDKHALVKKFNPNRIIRP